MSVPFSGTLGRSAGVVSAIGKQLKLLNLKAAKRITVKFDPFHSNITHTRNFLHLVSAEKIGLTNPECIIKTEVVCDRSEPSVNISLLPAITDVSGIKTITIRSGNLTCLEILQVVNKNLSTLAPKEIPTTTLQTKSEKKSAGKRKK